MASNYTLQNSFNDIDLILASDIEVMQQRHEVQGKPALHALYMNSSNASSLPASEDASGSQLINKCTSPECLARLIVYILELQGPMIVSDVIRFLQVATGNDEIALVLRVHFQGLIQLLQSFKQLFRLSDGTSYDPLVSLSNEFIAQKNILRQRAQAELSSFYSHEQLASQTLFSMSTEDNEMSLRERTSSTCTERVSELSMCSVASPDDKLNAVMGSGAPPLTSRSGGSAEDNPTIGPRAAASSIVLHPEALAHSIVCILEEKGPLKVGEVGKLLQVVVAPDGEINLAPIIKAQFKGLKKLIEGFRFLFWLDAAHPYNPTVHLTDEYHTAAASQNSLLLDSYFTFEPVNTTIPAPHVSSSSSLPNSNYSAIVSQPRVVNPPATACYPKPALKSTSLANSGNNGTGKKQLQVTAPAFVMTNVTGGSCNGLLGKLQKQTSSLTRSRQNNTNRHYMQQQNYYSSPYYNQSASAQPQQYRYSSANSCQTPAAFGFDELSSADGSTYHPQRQFGIDGVSSAAGIDATRFDGSRIELYRDYFNHSSSVGNAGYAMTTSDGKTASMSFEEASSDFSVAASPSSSSAEYSRVLNYLGI